MAVMDCIVNDSGESKHANIGISLPGTGESLTVSVFINGAKVKVLRGERTIEEFQAVVNEYARAHCGVRTPTVV